MINDGFKFVKSNNILNYNFNLYTSDHLPIEATIKFKKKHKNTRKRKRKSKRKTQKNI